MVENCQNFSPTAAFIKEVRLDTLDHILGLEKQMHNPLGPPMPIEFWEEFCREPIKHPVYTVCSAEEALDRAWERNRDFAPHSWS